jgi:RNA polymerase sigma factor (sigma-70 family)
VRTYPDGGEQVNPRVALLAERVRAVIESPSSRFEDLAKVTKLDPARDFRFGDWHGFDFSGIDLRPYDLTGADLTGACIDRAQIAGAKFDRARFSRAALSGAVDFDTSDVANPEKRLAKASNAEVAAELYVLAEKAVRRVLSNTGIANDPEPAVDRNLALLVEAVAARRDRDAFNELHEYFGPRIHALLLRSGLDPGVAEDLTQEVMIKLWRHAAQFDRTKSSVVTWLFCIARNARIDHFRRQRGEPPIGDEAMAVPDTAVAPDEAVGNMQLEDRVRAALSNLPYAQLAMVRLAFFEGLSHSEISERTGLPLGTVKARIRLALMRLRRGL